MKIGYVPGALDTLSGEHFPHFIHMRENVSALRKKVDVEVLTADQANALYKKFQKSRLSEMLNHKCMHLLRKAFHSLFFLAACKEVIRKINHEQKDVFVVRHSFSSNYLIARYLHGKGAKTLLEVHALAQVEERAYGQTRIPKWLSGSYFALVAHLEKRMLHWADRITTVSESLKSFLAEHGVEQRKIHAIHNAVDPEKFGGLAELGDVTERYNLDSKRVVGFVGSFARYHGVEMLPDVAERVEAKYDNLAFLLVGANVHGPDSPMESLCKKRVAARFVFTGEVPHSVIPQYVKAMDVAIIPDFNDYGSPMKLFEYMAMQKAIVAPDVPPIREVVKDGETAMLFEKGNPDEAARCIGRLLEDEGLRVRLGRKAHEKVMSCHTWDRNAERTVEIAESMTK
ncbi:MAG: glycosyltransferase family 4 protein [Thermodesulfobacteriota bacterium]|nr:glycosyltransferase family 4 protein [Thermodesulfobacteriota bacterium]